MIRLIKRWLTCWHEDQEFVRNIYGDEILVQGGKRSVWRCKECGKTILADVLVRESGDAGE